MKKIFIKCKDIIVILSRITKNLLQPVPFSWAIVSIFLVQLIVANNWIYEKIKNYKDFGIIVIFLAFAICVDWLWNSHIFDFIKIRQITPSDTLIDAVFCSSLVNLILFIIHRSIIPNSTIIIWSVVFIVASTGFFMLYRAYSINKLKLQIKNNENNKDNSKLGQQLVNLQQLFENRINWQKDMGPILVEERPVNYDLLNRSTVQRQLDKAINYYSPSHAYVVGVVGKWGSGKTTLLKKVKEDYSKNTNFIFMHAPGTQDEDLDLWLFGSKDEMIKGMYNTFLSNMGIEYNSRSTTKMLENISKVVAGIPNAGSMISPLISDLASYQEVVKLKKNLSKYLKSTKKHYLMCIENLDRASNEQVILLFKLISTVFDLPYVTYVLLYDNDRLNNILSSINEINGTYKEKVINQEVKLPVMINTVISKTCMRNLLLSYGFSNKEIEENFDVIINTIAGNLSNLRELKRVINSVFIILAEKDQLRLKYSEVLSIEYIFYSSPELYEVINDNKDLLVVTDPSEFNEISDFTTKKLQKITSKFSKYKELLEKLFPEIKVANMGERLIRIYYSLDAMEKSESICLPAYFDNYLLLTEEDYVEVNNLLIDFIKEINKSDINDIYQIWIQDIMDCNKNIRDKVLIQLRLFIKGKDIHSSQKRKLSNLLCK